MNHVLQLGSGTLEGKLAKALKEATVQGEVAKARDELVAILRNDRGAKFMALRALMMWLQLRLRLRHGVVPGVLERNGAAENRLFPLRETVFFLSAPALS